MFRPGRFPGFTLKSAFPFLTKETVAWRELLFIDGFHSSGHCFGFYDRIPFYANTESTYITKSDAKVGFYFRFLSVRLNRLKNKLLANYLRNRGNDLATVRNSAFCVAILSNNSFICKYNIFFRKYELSVAIL